MQMTTHLQILLFAILCFPAIGQDVSVFTFGGDKDEIGYDIVLGENNSLILLTSDRTVTSGSEDICLLEIDNAKNISSRKCFGTDKQDYPYSLIRTSDGGFAVSGTRWKSRRDAYLLKLNARFETEWEKHYDGGAFHQDEGFVAIETQDGGYLLSGMTRSSRGVTRGSMLLLKFSGSGEEEWVVHEEVTSKNYLFDVIQDRDGKFVSVGVESGHHRYTGFDFYLPSATGIIYKHDGNGNEIWRSSIGGDQNDWITNVVESPEGGYYLLGSTQSLGRGSFDLYLVKVDIDGEIEWEQTYGEFQFDYGRKLEILDNGDLLILGTTCLDSDNFTTDILLLRTDDQGSVLWQDVYGGAGSEVAHGMVVHQEKVHIVGEVTESDGDDKDVLLLEIPLNQTVDFDQRERDLNLLLVYPNPADQAVTFDLAELSCSNYQLNIYDQLGRVVSSRDHALTPKIEMDLTTWPKGTYFYTLSSGCLATIAGKLQIH